MYDRFDSDFNRAVDHLELSFEDQQSGLTCAQMTQLSLNLGFVKTCTEQEQTLLAQLWRILGGDEDGEGKVVLHFIKTIMCCIQNFHIDWIIDYQREESENGVKPSRVGRIEKDNIYFTPEEISYLTKKYVLLYRNRQDKFQ